MKFGSIVNNAEFMLMKLLESHDLELIDYIHVLQTPFLIQHIERVKVSS